MKQFLIIVFWLVGFASQAGETLAIWLPKLSDADVVILGEVHDNPVHHLNQARAVLALQPAAIVFEMLTQQQAARVTPGNRTDPAELSTVLGWAASGWPDFMLYYPIFAAAPHAQIIGGNLDRTDVRLAVTEGAAAVFGGDAQKYGLVRKLPEAQQSDREQLQKQAHCNALPDTLLAGMVEAQRLRDATIAAAILSALDNTVGPVVVITGNGHARNDWGVPALLHLAAPEVRVQSLGQFEESPWDPIPFDNHLVTQAADREDPCAVFNKD